MTESNDDLLPNGLGEAGCELWRSVMDAFELDVHERLLLKQACRVADLLDRLNDATTDAPLTVENAKGDVIANPLLVESRQQGIVLARLLAALRLPSGETDDRPQRSTGVRGFYQQRKYGSANLTSVG